MLGGYKKKKKVLSLAKQYAAKTDFDWTIYYKEMCELLRK